MTYRLNVYIRSGDFVYKTTLSDVGVATDEERSGVGVDGWQTGNVLPDLLEVCKWVFLSFHNCGHSTEGSSFELFAAVERVSKFEQSHVVFRDLGDEVSGSVELAQGELVVVLVVQDVEKGGEEGVEVLSVSNNQRLPTHVENGEL